MTIASRIRLYRAGWFASLAAFASWTAAFARVLMADGALTRAADALGVGPSVLVTWIASAGAACAASLLVLGTMSFAYRKTVSAELFFLSLWAFSLSFEALRGLTVQGALNGVPATFHAAVTRVVVIARFFGLFALFCAGLYASGYRNDRIGSVVLVALLAAVGIGAGIPLDSADLSTLPLLQRPAFGSLRALFESVIALITVADFAYAWLWRGERAYRLPAPGSALALGGSWLLRVAPDPALAALAFVAVCAGAFLVLKPVHEYYLWQ